jgi:hypothetical protein
VKQSKHLKSRNEERIFETTQDRFVQVTTPSVREFVIVKSQINAPPPFRSRSCPVSVLLCAMVICHVADLVKPLR